MSKQSFPGKPAIGDLTSHERFGPDHAPSFEPVNGRPIGFDAIESLFELPRHGVRKTRTDAADVAQPCRFRDGQKKFCEKSARRS